MGNFVIMGIQGCGKGTQAKLLARELGQCHVSVGDILRAHIENQTYLGRTVQARITEGRLVPDQIICQVVRTRLGEADCQHGFILDGFPRNAIQAEFLLEKFPIDMAINIVVPDELVTTRMLARRLCSGCGKDYNLRTQPPRQEGVCNDCGAPLAAREDDNTEAIAERLALFHAKSGPVLEVFHDHGMLVSVDGSGSVDEVQEQIRQNLEVLIGS